MDRQTLRLELLKLTYSHGRQASEAVARAKELEDFVVVELGQIKTGPTPLGKPGVKQKTAENDLDFLS